VEHRLIQGGEQFLPFARSRIKALRALGLPYADQSFEVDGVSIKVRIEPGHEYIRLEGGEGLLPMDSGAVDIGIVNPNFPVISPGNLYEAGNATSYNAPFVIPEDGSVWRKNPAPDAGQISGNLAHKAQSFRGAVPIDKTRARSFSPGNEIDTSTSPATAKDLDYDEALLVKKLTASLCPASMFTGRCRLWVQAMYGQYTYKEQAVGSIATKVPTSPPPPVFAGEGQPALFVTAKKPSEGRVWVGTSTGVHLSPTGKHWLIVITRSVTNIYPLRSDAAGEKARKYLIPGKAGKLTPQDVENLEAHILSTARPVISEMTTCAGVDIHAWSMGYGWHWNWSGTCADIVVTENFKQPNDGTVNGSFLEAMESTHWRFSLSESVTDGVTTWNGSSATVEGPIKWSAPRPFWTLCEPDWAFLGMVKVNPRYTTQFACNAPFYAFYKKDDLVVCRVAFTQVDEVPPNRAVVSNFTPSRNNVYAESWYGGVITGQTEGMMGGSCTDQYTTKYFSGSVQVGGEYTASNLLVGMVHAEQFHSTTYLSAGTPTYSPPEANAGNYNYAIGYTLASGTYSTTYDFSEFRAYVYSYPSDTSVIDEKTNIWESSEVTLIAPVYDAEALFAHSQHDKVTTGRERTETIWTVHGLLRSTRAHHGTYPGTPGAEYVYYDVSSPELGGMGHTEPNNLPDIDLAESWGVRMELVSKTTVPVTNFSAGSIHMNDTDDSVPESLWAISGTGTREPVVISNNRFAPVGAPADLSKQTYPVLVGWV